jgi:hypothetical protein
VRTRSRLRVAQEPLVDVQGLLHTVNYAIPVWIRSARRTTVEIRLAPDTRDDDASDYRLVSRASVPASLRKRSNVWITQRAVSFSSSNQFRTTFNSRSPSFSCRPLPPLSPAFR